jgi:hypothetical protein
MKSEDKLTSSADPLFLGGKRRSEWRQEQPAFKGRQFCTVAESLLR